MNLGSRWELISKPQSSACCVIYVSLAASQAGLFPRAVYKAVAEVSDAPSSCLSQALSRVPGNSPIPALVGESVNCFQTCGMNAAAPMLLRPVAWETRSPKSQPVNSFRHSGWYHAGSGRGTEYWIPLSYGGNQRLTRRCGCPALSPRVQDKGGFDESRTKPLGVWMAQRVCCLPVWNGRGA